MLSSMLHLIPLKAAELWLISLLMRWEPLPRDLKNLMTLILYLSNVARKLLYKSDPQLQEGMSSRLKISK